MSRLSPIIGGALALLSGALCAPAAAGGAKIDPAAVDLRAGLGPILRSDRGTPVGLLGGLAIELEAPVLWRFGLRADFASAMDSRDQIAATGPTITLMPLYRQPLGPYFLDVAAGPGLWTGRSAWWGGAYPGPFPSVRGAVGFGLQPHPLVSGRLELGTDHAWGTRPFVNGKAHGFDLRLIITGHAPIGAKARPKRPAPAPVAEPAPPPPAEPSSAEPTTAQPTTAEPSSAQPSSGPPAGAAPSLR